MQTVIAVSGVKNSGKTTLLTRLVAELSAEGYKVAVIKHDGHDFECDVPGTDTRRFMEHGAYATACFSENRMFVHRTGTGESYEELIKMFPHRRGQEQQLLQNRSDKKLYIARAGIRSGRKISNSYGYAGGCIH